MKIGILSGMGAAAGVRFHDMIVKECQQNGAIRDVDFPEIMIQSIASRGMDNTGIKDTHIIKKDIVKCFKYFNFWGCRKIIIACNTVHKYLDYFQKYSGAPILNMPQIALEYGKEFNLGVIGSRSTKEFGLYSKAKVQTKEKEQIIVDRIIQKIIEGNIEREDRDYLYRLIQAMRFRGAEKIILGCTELPLAYPADDSIIDAGLCVVKKALE